jgi:hypothetical protein
MAALMIKKRVGKVNHLKRIIAVGLMILFYFQMCGSNGPGFVEGTQLFVMANSGLTLRIEPSLDAESLGVVEFGSSVQVLNQPDSLQYTEVFNWVEGKWIFVEYDGIKGYMFDGYLSDLPIPVYEFERCQMDLDLVYPLESWAEVNLGENNSKTLEAGVLKKVTSEYVGGEKMVRSQKDDNFKLELYLTEVRLMDAYHLLQSMIDAKSRLEIFKDESIFIKDKDGDLYKVKIKLDNPIEIIKLKSGDVKIVIHSDNYLCSL